MDFDDKYEEIMDKYNNLKFLVILENTSEGNQ